MGGSDSLAAHGEIRPDIETIAADCEPARPV